MIPYFWGILPLTVYTWMLTILVRRNIAQYKEESFWNWGRFLIILVLFSLGASQFFFLLQDIFPNSIKRVGFLNSNSTSLNVYTLTAGLTVTFGLMFSAYINSWRIFQYVPLMFVLGAMWFYLETGYMTYFEYYTYINKILFQFFYFYFLSF